MTCQLSVTSPKQAATYSSRCHSLISSGSDHGYLLSWTCSEIDARISNLHTRRNATRAPLSFPRNLPWTRCQERACRNLWRCAAHSQSLLHRSELSEVQYHKTTCRHLWRWVTYSQPLLYRTKLPEVQYQPPTMQEQDIGEDSAQVNFGSSPTSEFLISSICWDCTHVPLGASSRL